MKALIIFLLTPFLVLADELPPELANLTKQRDAAVDRIDRKYMDEVNALKERYTKSGKLAEALACDGILDKLDKSKALPTSFIVGTKWVDPKGRVFTFENDYFSYKDIKAPWKQDGQNLIIQMPALTVTVAFDSSMRTMQELNGWKIKWTRVD